MGNGYHLNIDEVLSQFNSTADRGLSKAEASRRLMEHGPNELQAARRISPWAILFEQFKNILVLILLIAVVLSAFLGHSIEAIAIAVILLFAVLLGFVQEYRAERAIEALKRMAAPTATVIRDGEEMDMPARDLVPGDIILIRAGDRIAADARLVEAVNLQIEEASLTGESVPVEKNTQPLPNIELAVGDRKNMVYAGTVTTYGRGRGLVVATGMQTEFGKIAQLLQTVETGKTPLQENLDKVGRLLARVGIAVVVLIVGLGLFRGQPFLEILIFGIALAVAVVPEALPAVVTISLALGVQRMVKRNALIRRLSAVETLGSTSVICSDKTGTLTKDEMTIRKIFAAGQMLEVSGAGYDPHGEFSWNGSIVETSPAIMALLRAAVLASDTHLVQNSEGGQWHIKGDPTEGALIVAAAKAGLDKTDLDTRFPRVHEIPFTSETKRMTTLHTSPDGPVAYSKGAPEVILDSCTHQLTETGETQLKQAEKEAILETGRQMASNALRVLALACKSNAGLENAEQGMVFLGLVGMIAGGRQGSDDHWRSSSHCAGHRPRIGYPQGGPCRHRHGIGGDE